MTEKLVVGTPQAQAWRTLSRSVRRYYRYLRIM